MRYVAVSDEDLSSEKPERRGVLRVALRKSGEGPNSQGASFCAAPLRPRGDFSGLTL